MSAPTRRLRVAFLTSARTWRGSTVSLSSIAAGLRGRGHEVRILAGESAIVEAVLQGGVPAELVPSRNTGWREVVALRRILRRDGVDAVMADRPRDLRVAALASLGRPTALVYRFNVRRERPPRDLVTWFAYRKVAATIFLTPEWAERTLERVPFMNRAPYQVIWNGVDAELFRPDPAGGAAFRARHQLGDGQVLIASGALYRDKRLDLVIEAVSRLPSPPPVLLVCGVGPELEHLQELARAREVPARFPGFLAAAELRGALNAATLLLHAGAVETFGRSVAEAMACARPVVAVRAGSLVDVVGEAGVLVPPDDPEAMAQAVLDLLRDPERREELGELARARIHSRFSQEQSLDGYERLLLQVVAAE